MVENNSSKSMSLDEFIEHLKQGEIPKEALRKEKHNGKIKFYVIPIEKELEEITKYYAKIFNDSIGQENYVYDKEEVKTRIKILKDINKTIYQLKCGWTGKVNFTHLWSNAKNKLAPNEATAKILLLRYNDIETNLRKSYNSLKLRQNTKFNRFYKK